MASILPDAELEVAEAVPGDSRAAGRASRPRSRDEDRDHAGLELIGKVSAVLRLLEREEAATAAQIASVLEEPLSSVYRLLQSLSVAGWVERAPRRGMYRLGLTLMSIGGLVEDQLDIREASLPSLRSLVSAIGVTSFLCVRRGSRGVCLERLEGFAVQSLAMQLGSSLPLYSGAGPRVLLAFLPGPEQQSLIHLTDEKLTGDPPRPTVAEMLADVAQIRESGFAVSDGDVTPGIAAVGAPVYNHRGEVDGALSISGLRSQLLGPQRQRNLALVLGAAGAASAALGYEVR